MMAAAKAAESAVVAGAKRAREFSSFAKLGIDAVDVAGKRVLVRVDFNVPFADVSSSECRRLFGSKC